MEIGHSIIHELNCENKDIHYLNNCIKGNGPISHSCQSYNQTFTIKRKQRSRSSPSPYQDYPHKPETILSSSKSDIHCNEGDKEDEEICITLPNELLDLIFSYCDLKTLLTLSCVCKRFTECWSSVLYLDLRKESRHHCISFIKCHLPKLNSIKRLILPPTKDRIDIIDSLCRLTTLENLVIPSIHYIEPNKIQKLSKLTRLVSLSINLAFNFKPDQLSFLNSLSRLEHLKIEIFQNNIMERLSKHIILLTNLRSIDFSWCKNITCEFLLSLSQLENLNVLKFDMCLNLNDNELEAISSIKTLMELSFRWCQYLTDKGVSFLARLPRLEKLNLSNCRHITPKGISVLPKTCKVKILPFQWCNIEK